MEVRYIGESAPLRWRKGKIYVVIAVEEKPDGGSYRVVDESGEDYPYLIKSFELVGGSVEDIDPNDPVFNLSPDGEEDNESEPQDVILFNLSYIRGRKFEGQCGGFLKSTGSSRSSFLRLG